MEELIPDESCEADSNDRKKPVSGLVKEQYKLFKLIAEERADSHAQSRPDHRPGCIVKEKGRGTHPHDGS